MDTPAPAPAVKDISDEQYREYSWQVVIDGKPASVTYRITNPVGLVVGNTTHRVVDADGLVHCVPNVGERGCVLRWKAKDGAAPVRF